MNGNNNIGMRIRITILSLTSCIAGIFVITQGEWIGGIILLLMGLVALSLCWIKLITNGRTDANTLFPFMLLIFGMVFVGGGIYSLASRIYVVTAGEHVTAKIEGFKSWTDELTTTNPLQNSDGNSSSKRSGIAYVSYEIDGKEYLSSLNQGNSEYRVGQLIEVAYLPNSPEKIYPCQFGAMGLCVIIIIGIGVVYLGIHMLKKR